MPEAPWIKRCTHGITFTSQVNLEKQPYIAKQKYKWLFYKKNDKKKVLEKKIISKGQDMQLSANAAS